METEIIINKDYVNGLKAEYEKAIRDGKENLTYRGSELVTKYAEYFIEYWSSVIHHKQDRKPALFKNGEKITFLTGVEAIVTGYVGFHPNLMLVRVQYTGGIVDYDPYKLFVQVKGAKLK